MEAPFGLAQCIRKSWMLETATRVLLCPADHPDHFYHDTWMPGVDKSTTLGILASGDLSNCHF